MFKYSDVPTKDGRIRDACRKLIDTIRTEVEHKRVTNDSSADIDRGDIVYATSGDRLVDLAVNDTQPHADWVGVMAEPTADGETGIARTGGYAEVKLVVTDDPEEQAGMFVYVSDVAGQGTTTPPAGPLFSKIVGVLADATQFDPVTNPFVWVQLLRCCEPIEVQK